MFVWDMDNSACITAFTTVLFSFYMEIVYEISKKNHFFKIISSPKQILNLLWTVVLVQYCKLNYAKFSLQNLFDIIASKVWPYLFVDCWKVVKMLERTTKADWILIESFTVSVLINPVHSSLWFQIILNNHSCWFLKQSILVFTFTLVSSGVKKRVQG